MKREAAIEYVREIVMLTLELLFKGDFQFTEIFIGILFGANFANWTLV